MLFLNECKYHAKCGLCTYYDKMCDEVCGYKKSPNNQNDMLSKIKSGDVITSNDVKSDLSGLKKVSIN